MKLRFEADRLTPWRQRFLAIAREVAAAERAARREARAGQPAARRPVSVRTGARQGVLRTA